VSRGSDAAATPERVLFLCVHNSARSQIAEGLARHAAPAGAQVWSAGSEPRSVHPMAIEVMREIGIDLSDQRSKSLDQVPWREADTVVTLCGEAEEVCPVLPSQVRKLHWPLADPSLAAESEQREAFRRVRDEIGRRIAALWRGAS
jgi:arsenate reductase